MVLWSSAFLVVETICSSTSVTIIHVLPCKSLLLLGKKDDINDPLQPRIMHTSFRLPYVIMTDPYVTCNIGKPLRKNMLHADQNRDVFTGIYMSRDKLVFLRVMTKLLRQL